MLLFVYIFIGISIAIAVFQIISALGAPLGEFTLGGKYPGKLPGKMRIAAILQIIILFMFNMVVVSKSAVAFEFLFSISRIGVWGVFVFLLWVHWQIYPRPAKMKKWLWPVESYLINLHVHDCNSITLVISHSNNNSMNLRAEDPCSN